MTLAVRMLGKREEAEEAVQDAFVRAFRALPGFGFRSSFATWLYRIVYNVCLTELSRRNPTAQEPVGEAGEPDVDVADDAMLPDVEVEAAEFRRIVEEEIRKLPSPYAATMVLFLMDDLSYEEIVEATGLPLGTVKARLFRGRMWLRNAVAKRMGETSAAGASHVPPDFAKETTT